ncbi:serine O-acetyltransferase EpsC [Bacillus cereus]|uniref:Serine acetyltransferase n=2 Tax=Bacillus cereus group TaxID=86661 RepID=R8QAX0_BACCE|nr:serine O-acetyltransferase EpsC [Bacillus cereus]EOP67892.1 hypothetical protein IIQ_05192 [Bacillus cereus VD118]MBJ8095539.1 serine acetyltransferase [Bacillus cereus]CAH2464461.1 Serine acetyltransferase [Bacillus mycoides KBAB4]
MSKFSMDLESFIGRSPRFFEVIKLLLINHSVQCTFFFRMQSFLYKKKVPMLPNFIKWLNIFITGADIGISAEIGEGLNIRHTNGIVIGNGVVIGKNCTILHQVTLGERYGDGRDPLHAYPIVGDNVVISTGVKIIGGISIGDNVMIGANAVVVKDVPANNIAIGIPAVNKLKKIEEVMK